MGRALVVIAAFTVVGAGCTYSPVSGGVRDLLETDGRSAGDSGGGGDFSGDSAPGDFTGDGGDASGPVTNLDRGAWTGVVGSAMGPWTQTLGSSASSGGVSAAPGNSFAPAVAIAPTGERVVVWQQTDGDIVIARRIAVRIQDPSTGNWSSPTSEILTRGGSTVEPDVAVAGDGSIWVTWQAGNGIGSDIYAARYAGGMWSEAFGSATGSGVSDDTGSARRPSIAMFGDKPCIAWSESTGSGQDIYAKCLEVTGWLPPDGVSALIASEPPAAAEPRPDLATTSTDLVLAWQGYDMGMGVDVVRAQRFSGSAWVGIAGSDGVLGIPSPTMGDSLEPTVAANDASVLVAFRFGAECIHVLRWTAGGGTWEEFDDSATGCGISDSNVNARLPQIALVGGRPLVAWQQGQPPQEIYWADFDGSDWSSPQNLSSNSGVSRTPALATAGVEVLAAWEDDTSGALEIYALRDEGTGFQEFGGVVMTGGLSDEALASHTPELAMRASGLPALVWAAGPGGQETLEGIRFEGLSNTWGRVDTLVPALGGVQTPALAIDGEEIVVAWQERFGNDTDILLGRNSGGTWETVTFDGNNAIVATDVNSTIQERIGVGFRSGDPWVVYTDNVNHPGLIPEVYLRRFEGSWLSVGMSDTGGGISDTGTRSAEPIILLGSNKTQVVWTEGVQFSETVRAAFFDDTLGQWFDLNLGDPAGIRAHAAFDFDENLVIVYEQRGPLGSSEIRALRLESGGAVTDLGAVSSTTGVSSWPRVAVDSLGAPVVTWQDDSTGHFEIYLRRYDRGVWQEVSSSARGGGISNSTGFSRRPVVATSDTYLCVAWLEADVRAPQVTMRCVNGM